MEVLVTPKWKKWNIFLNWADPFPFLISIFPGLKKNDGSGIIDKTFTLNLDKLFNLLLKVLSLICEKILSFYSSLCSSMNKWPRTIVILVLCSAFTSEHWLKIGLEAPSACIMIYPAKSLERKECLSLIYYPPLSGTICERFRSLIEFWFWISHML